MTAVQSSGLGEIFFFPFLLGLFVLETLVTSNSKVILKTTEPCVEIGAPSFDSLFLYFIPPYPTNAGSRIHNPNFMSHFVCCPICVSTSPCLGPGVPHFQWEGSQLLKPPGDHTQKATAVYLHPRSLNIIKF